MNAEVSSTGAAHKASPKLRVARLDDAEQIRRLEMAHFGATLPHNEWRSLWLDNPLWPRLGDRWPIGWVLEDRTDQIVGSLLNIPALYHFRGRELINATGRGWAVDSDFRGYALWLLDEYYNQPGVDLFINNTINRLAEDAHRSYSTRIPLGQWDTVSFWVTGYRGFARKALQRMRIPFSGILSMPAAACLWLKDALRGNRLAASTHATASGIVVEAVSEFDARFDEFWHELVSQNTDKLLALRDSKTLTWHYAIPQRKGRLWVYTATRNSQLRAYCVLKRQDGNDGIRRMRLVDYQTLEPDTDFLAGMLQAAIQRSVGENMYVLELLGLGLPGMGSFDCCAPYRRRWPHWPFYFQTNDSAITAELSAAEAWNPSSYDGDASFE
jgi:hypothetical protein